MNENEMSQQQQDDPELDAICKKLGVGKYYDLARVLETAANSIALTNKRSEGVRLSVATAFHAADYIRKLRRSIDALTAERDRLRADNERLRVACEGVDADLGALVLLANERLSLEATQRHRATIAALRAALSADGESE